MSIEQNEIFSNGQEQRHILLENNPKARLGCSLYVSSWAHFFIIVAFNVCLYTGYVSKLQATGMRLSSSNRPLYGVGTTTQMQNSLPCEIS